MFIQYHVSPEYKDLIEDIVKTTIIFIVVQMLMIVSGHSSDMFGIKYIELFVCVVLGISTYWLVVTKLVRIDSSNSHPMNASYDVVARTPRNQISYADAEEDDESSD